MPLTRYQIRNEYSLADPELYRAADKDDPEALLEGVAMAGLVGVLRQLGDLAEFAAEIFHDLHEEVMVTAARGHGLMVRVQQLETDFPSIEKEFLSQTRHSLFFYDPGVAWHPNLRIDQNLIMQGDLPRFVMESYEECRGPPRLFLLDKFDVAGAGACLKRYTDPSFFKEDSSSSGMTKAVHKEKKTRKNKRKGSRWRNGETPEVRPTSHAKLHQLFMEESVENYVSNPARRVKLKRRLNGFPFDSKTGKSYMEKLLNNPSSDHNVRDISVNSSPLRLPSNINGDISKNPTPDRNVRDISVNSHPLRLSNINGNISVNSSSLPLSSNINGESGIKILEISAVNPGKELPWRKRSPCLSPDAKKTRQKPSIAQLNEVVDYGISEVPNLNPISEAVNVHEDVDEKEVAANRAWKIEGSVNGYQSDDIASEVENYMDALTTMDSDMETDNECRAKKDLHILNTENLGMNSDANVELQDLQAHFSDSQSIGNFTATDDENSSSRKGLFSFSYSDSLGNSADNAQSESDVSSNVLPSTGTREAESVIMSSDLAAGRMVSNGVRTEEFSSFLSDSTISPVNPGESSIEGESVGLKSYEISSDRKTLTAGYLNTEENTAHHCDNLPCTFNCSDDPSQTKYDSLRELSETHSVYRLDNEDSHILSDSSGKKSSENSVDDVVQTDYAEDECPETSVDDPIETLHSVALQEKLLDSALPELETWCPDIKPDGIVSDSDDAPSLSGEIEISSIPVVYGPRATDVTEQQFPRISEHFPPLELDSADAGFPYYGKKNLNEAFNAADGEGMGASPCDTHVFSEEAADLELSSDLHKSPVLPSVPNVHLDDVTTEPVHPDVVMVDEDVAGTPFYYNGGDGKALSGSPTKLQEESFVMVQDLDVNIREINEVCSQEHLQESGTEKEADLQGVASSFSNSFSGSTVSCDDSNSEVLNNVPDSAMAAPSISSLQIVDATTVALSLDQHDQQSELKSSQEIKLIADAEDDRKVELRYDQIDVASQQDQDDAQTVYAIPTNSLLSVDASTVRLFSYQHDRLPESEYAQLINSIEDAEDVSSLNCHIAELKFPLEQKFDLQDDQCDVASHCGEDSESKSSHGIVVENAEDVVSSPTRHIGEVKTPFEQHDRPFDAESLLSDKTRSDPVMKLIQFPNQADNSSGFCVAHLPSKPSVLLPQVDVSKKAKEPSFSALPSNCQFPGASQINLDEMPPLPPLPPMQWRIGKVQNTSLASKRDLGGHNVSSYPPMLLSTADENNQFGHPAVVEEIAKPSNPFLLLSASKGETSQHCYDNSAGYMVHSDPLSLQDANGDHDIPTSGRPQSKNSFLPTVCGEKSGHGFAASHGETEQPSKNPFSPATNIQDVVLKDPSKSLPEELDCPLHQTAPERSLEDKKLQGAFVIPEGIAMNTLKTTFPTTIQDDQPHNVSMSGEQHPWSLSTPIALPSFEDGQPNGNRLPRPRNPLIDAVMAHDKSKLRKVTERVQSHIEQKIEERDSLLEQIRTKSFNLKPAALKRPSIQGPKTNLNVAAILEKANAIRQAFAGSDEDNDADSWSDA